MAGRDIEIILGGLDVEPGLRCDGPEQAMGLIRIRFAAAQLTVGALCRVLRARCVRPRYQ